MSVVLIERQCFGRQAARTAHHWTSFPLALAQLARVRGVGEVEIHIMHHYQIEIAIAVEVNESAPSAPSILRGEQTAFLRFVLEKCHFPDCDRERSAPTGHKQIGKSVIVNVADAKRPVPSRCA